MTLDLDELSPYDLRRLPPPAPAPRPDSADPYTLRPETSQRALDMDRRRQERLP